MPYDGSCVLVAGGTGFVGSHFVEALLKRGARVRVPIHARPLRVADDRIETVKADLMNPADCRRVCGGVDAVIHAAGAVFGAGGSGTNPMAPIAANLAMTANLLEGAWEARVPRLLLFSSSTGYPPADHPVTEDEFWCGEVHPAYLGYGWMRRYFEKMGAFVHERSETKIALVRPTAIYGRHDNFDPATSHVIPALIRRAVARDDPYVVWGRQTVVRDFLHVTDLVAGSLLALEKKADCDPVNIGYGETVTVGEIVTAILRGADYADATVTFDESKPTTLPFRQADITKARDALGFAPAVSLADGLRDTIDWYRRTLA